MQVLFLGGASGVGASCLAIQLANQWFVVDAGVRVDRKSDPLPDLALLEGKDVRAIFVTHAHADHIGALPLLHQAFPTVPIFASRATALLMEVMLADALKVMTRRAVEEMEIPLYPESLVSGMLTQARPLPVGEPVTLPMLPGITIHASRAGHIAGAVSLGFVASDGSVVVSGDISSTPQRTVLGAVPPPLDYCDILVLESTYGARLHPNRQAEEQRLAQAVAEGLANGGHTLIPCFALGRGQEILLLLQAAQEQGQIPDFPIYVDGLVRRVCSTYLLLPEALTPRLQRQIRKGYLPFTGPNVTFVRDERDRERILAGPPACILSSSGMLTGGPSAWYAARLAPDPNASILITGYQDEEAAGRKLLDLAEHKKSTLDIGGQQVEVHCRVARYNLSAHADGGELSAFAAALRPNRVALVHGDDEARTALRGLLTGTDVVLPVEGMTLEKEVKQRGPSIVVAPLGGARGGVGARGVDAGARGRGAPSESPQVLDTLPVGIGKGVPFDYTHVEELWRAVTQVPALRIVTARELALVWYGEATEETTRDILDTFVQDYEQRYFVRQHALEEAFRVRRRSEEVPHPGGDEGPGDFLSDLVGSVLLLRIAPESSKPVICRAIEPGASVRVQLGKGVSQERTRFPFSAILEVLGPAPQEMQESYSKASVYLNDLVKATRRIRRTLSAHDLARQCQEEVLYTLGELCEMAGLWAQSLEDGLAMAKFLHQHPLLFVQQRTVFDGEGLTLYGLAPEWREVLEEPEERERPDQNWILSVIEQYLGSPPDLYRRSVDPDTGDVVLAFHFPAVAAQQYAEAIAAASEETGVSITIAPQAHQGALARAARQHVPQSLTVRGTPSIYHDRCVVSLNCTGQASEEELAQAQISFYEETGWYLEIVGAQFIAPNHTVGADLSQPTADLSASRGPIYRAPGTLNTAEAAHPGDDQAAHPGDDQAPGLFQEVRPAQREPMNQHDALLVAQRMLSKLPDYQKAGLDATTSSLLLRFHFPKVAQTRYAELFSQLEAQTGWYVRLHPTTNQQALSEMALRVLPPGLVCNGTPSLYLDQETVGVQCLGDATPEGGGERMLSEELPTPNATLAPLRSAQHPLPSPANIAMERGIQDAQQQFLEETGWQLQLVLPGQKAQTPGRMPQGEVMARASEMFSKMADFYRVGVDANRGNLWLHFHFPDIARKRYSEQLDALAAQTGWRVYLHPNVHQKALIEAARRLLPEGTGIAGKASVFQERRTLSLTPTGGVSEEAKEEMQRWFAEETGWKLEILPPAVSS
jgi:Cft2 family RNA processing exonuclease